MTLPKADRSCSQEVARFWLKEAGERLQIGAALKRGKISKLIYTLEAR